MKIAVIKSRIHSISVNSINTLKHAQGFSYLGHEVEVLTYDYSKSNQLMLRISDVHKFHGLNKQIKIKYFKGSLLSNIRSLKFFRVILLYLLRLVPKISDHLDPEIKICNYCLKNKIDLAFCRESLTAAYNNIINKIPTIIDMHGSEIYGLENIVKLRDNKYFRGIMTLNDVIKQNLVEKGFPKEKIAVMENGVDLEIFDKITEDKINIRKKLKIPLDNKIILYSGAIGYSRGLDIIMDAARRLDNKKYSFYFVGGGPKKALKNWRNIKEKYRSHTEIKFLGLKPKKIIPLYLKAADILLAIYSSDLSTQKVMSPVKIIEYMASKTPFIATKIGRNIEICNNSECLFTNPDDSKDLSEKIELIISNEDLRDKLVENAYKRAKNYSIKKRCNKIIELSLL